MKPIPAEHDAYIIQKILMYCDQIQEAITQFGEDKSMFLSNSVYRNAVSLCILQIGELSSLLTQDFRTEHSEVSWRKLKEMCNIVAHRYGTLEPEEIWEITSGDIPTLRNYLPPLI